jgi:Histidine kinase
VWQRWWFRASVVLGLTLLGFSRPSVPGARLLETVRTRIASDLHDDIGSSLSQIAILSEVARTGAGDDARVAAPLGRIATLSRESVDAMGDIVWAIDPHRDTPMHLAQRMRRLASDLLSARGIEVRFDWPIPATLCQAAGSLQVRSRRQIPPRPHRPVTRTYSIRGSAP